MKMLKGTLLVTVLMALCAALSWAQQDSPGQQQPQQQDPQQQQQQPSSQSDQSMGSPSATSGTVKGCLSGTDGNYLLTQDGTGAMVRLSGSDGKLKSHIGHEVMVTGQLTSAGSASSDPNRSDAATGSGGNIMQVTDVKMVSKHCSSGGDSTPQSH